MTLVSFIGGHLLALALLTAAAGVLGWKVLGTLPFSDPLERSVFACAAGLGILANLVHLLGFLGGIRPWLLLALVAAPLLLGLFAWRRESRDPAWTKGRDTAALALLAFGLAPAAILALYPPMEFDSTLYHLPYAKAFSTRHAIAFLPELRFPVFPQLIEMLFTMALSLWDDVSAQLIHVLCLALTTFAVAAWGRRLATPRAGIWAAAAWLGSPIVLATGAAAYVDLGLALFGTLCLMAWSRWRETGDRHWLAWSAVLAGFAASTKYHGLFFVAAIPAAELIPAPGVRGLRAAGRFLAISILVLLPFYARIVAGTGNPVFPYLSGWFGATVWTQSFDPVRSGGLSSALEPILPLARPRRLGQAAWDLFFPGPLRKATYSPFLIFLPPLLGAAAITWRRHRALGAFVLAYVVCWYVLNPVPRYLLPVIPACLAVSAAFVDETLRKRSRGSPSLRGYALGAAFVLMLPGTLWGWRRVWRRGPVPTTPAARENYLDRSLPVHAALRGLNSTLGSQYTVYGLFCENAAYYARGRFLGDYFGPYRYQIVLAALGDGRDLYDTLRRFGATHLLVAHRPGFPLPQDDAFVSLFDPIPSPPGVSLFFLRPQPKGSGGTEETPLSSSPFPTNDP